MASTEFRQCMIMKDYGLHVARSRSKRGIMAKNISEYLRGKAQLCGEDVELAQAWVQLEDLYTKKYNNIQIATYSTCNLGFIL